MPRNDATQITGWGFVAAAAMLWLGWMLLPVRIGTFFQTDDFAAVYDQLHFWIWMYRIHLFGIVIAVGAQIALGSMLTGSTARLLIWPGVGIVSAGAMVSACAEAFYYHFGAWGALDMHVKSAEAVGAFVASLEISSEYVSCLVRFGRVFGGFGLLLLGCGLMKWKVMPMWAGSVAAVIGVAAMAVTMGLPDDLDLYLPIFHLHAFWLAAVGIQTLRSGVRTD